MESNHGAERKLTVAQVRFKEGSDEAQVLFLESARVYRLPKAHPQFDFLLAMFHAAMQRGKRLIVTTTMPEGDLLESAAESPGHDGGR
jgi:hypothetical protein